MFKKKPGKLSCACSQDCQHFILADIFIERFPRGSVCNLHIVVSLLMLKHFYYMQNATWVSLLYITADGMILQTFWNFWTFSRPKVNSSFQLIFFFLYISLSQSGSHSVGQSCSQTMEFLWKICLIVPCLGNSWQTRRR